MNNKQTELDVLVKRHFILTRHLFLLRIGRWTLYFPSSLAFGSSRVPNVYQDWSLCYLTLEKCLHKLPSGG